MTAFVTDKEPVAGQEDFESESENVVQKKSDKVIKYLIRAMGTSYIGQMAIADSDVMAASIFSCVVCAVAIIFWSMLLVGVCKNNKCLIMTWLVMTMLHLLVSYVPNKSTF